VSAALRRGVLSLAERQRLLSWLYRERLLRPVPPTTQERPAKPHAP
jgi:hypothetical protein